MANLLIPVALAAILSILGFLSWHIVKRFEKAHFQLLSFSAGILITLILFRFIPILNTATDLTLIYTLLLTGFAAFYLTEEWVYTHTPKGRKRKRVLTEFHALGFAFDRAIIGIALLLVFLLGTLLSVFVIFVPLLIHVLAGSHSITHLRSKLRHGHAIATAISAAIFLGALAAIFLQTYVFEVFAFVVGVLLYLTIRDVVPKLHEGKPLWFVLGIAVTLVLFLLTGVA